jgi:hypothetical protein
VCVCVYIYMYVHIFFFFEYLFAYVCAYVNFEVGPRYLGNLCTLCFYMFEYGDIYLHTG